MVHRKTAIAPWKGMIVRPGSPMRLSGASKALLLPPVTTGAMVDELRCLSNTAS